MKRVALAALFGSALLGCAREGGLDIQVPESLDPHTKQLVLDAWPKVKKACAGLDRHADGLKFKGIQDNHHVDIVFEIPESGTSIPPSYMAGGQTCYYGLARDGKQLVVSKEGCKAVCLDREMGSEDVDRGDLVINL